MEAIASVYFAALGQASESKEPLFSTQPSAIRGIRGFRFRSPNSISRAAVYCAAAPHASSESGYSNYGSRSWNLRNEFFDIPPTVAETKLNFLKSYKRPIPSIYNNVLQELLIQQHLMRYKRTYQYDAVFALGFVTIYEQLMEGYPSLEDQDAIFRAYIKSLREDPEQYRDDAKKLEEWGRSQDATKLVDFSSRGGDVENVLKDIAERVQGLGNFTYSRFFAVGIFRLLELANAAEPSVLEKFCAALKINKRSVDRDLDVYRNLLSKLVQAKELLNEYVDREKKKREGRVESQKANEAITNCIGDYQYVKRSFTELKP